MKKSIAIISLGLMIGCAIFLSGCTTNETGGAGVGTIRLLITDKPADLDIIYANVTISMVQVYVASTSDDEVEEEIVTNGTTKEGFTASANGKYEGNIGEDIEFFGSATDGEEPYINWSWDFGDGTVSYEQNPIHNYSTAGVFAVNLTVTDNTSATAWESTFAKIGQEEDESDTGWYTIVNESQTFDLIALQDVTELLGEKNLTAGKYTQIRLTVESAVITLNESGTIVEHDLEIPSEKIKLIKPFTIVDNETTVLTLDFDVYKSIHETGSGKYMMKPTIKVIQG
jgi:PKD repeat protein